MPGLRDAVVVPEPLLAVSRQTVRAAVYAWFAPPNVAGLNTLYTAKPKIITAQDFRRGQPAGTKTGTVGVVNVTRSTEQRIALGGAFSGWKQVSYVVEIQVYCHSTQQKAEDAQDDFDAMFDALVARLRADRTLGSTVWEAGEDALEGQFGEPAVVSGSATERWAALRFVVIEQVQA